MNKIYTITIVTTDNNKTWYFTNEDMKDEVLDYIDTLGIKDKIDVQTDEFFANSDVDTTKREVFNFLND